MWGAAPTPPGHDAPHDVPGPPDVGLSQSAIVSLGQGNPLPRGLGARSLHYFNLTHYSWMFLLDRLGRHVYRKRVVGH